MTACDDVLLTVSDGVARLTFNRPDTLNALTPQMGETLLQHLTTIASDDAIRAVLITGAGRAFSAGADLKGAREILPDGSPDLSGRLERIYNPCILRLRALEKPVVAGVNGVAAGLGAGVALACDLIVAAESATFLFAFVDIALSPDGGSLAHAMARIGSGRAAELAMLGERLPAATALEWGLVNAVHPDDECVDAADALTRRLAAGPTIAYGSIKAQLNRAVPDLADRLAQEARLQQRHAATSDYPEGVAAFNAKRPARFTGR